MIPDSRIGRQKKTEWTCDGKTDRRPVRRIVFRRESLLRLLSFPSSVGKVHSVFFRRRIATVDRSPSFPIRRQIPTSPPPNRVKFLPKLCRNCVKIVFSGVWGSVDASGSMGSVNGCYTSPSQGRGRGWRRLGTVVHTCPPSARPVVFLGQIGLAESVAPANHNRHFTRKLSQYLLPAMLTTFIHNYFKNT